MLLLNDYLFSNKFIISKAATVKLGDPKSKTGLTKTGLKPNVLCRIGFCLSLSEAEIPNPDQYDRNGMEFNRYTLLGDYEALYLAVLKERLLKDAISEEGDLERYFRAHMNRGVDLLDLRIRALPNFLELIPRGIKSRA